MEECLRRLVHSFCNISVSVIQSTDVSLSLCCHLRFRCSQPPQTSSRFHHRHGHCLAHSAESNTPDALIIIIIIKDTQMCCCSAEKGEKTKFVPCLSPLSIIDDLKRQIKNLFKKLNTDEGFVSRDLRLAAHVLPVR